MYCVDPDQGIEHVDALMQYLEDAVADADGTASGEVPLEQGRLRFFAHLIIFLRNIGLLPRRLKPMGPGSELGKDNERVAIGNMVIGKYVESLAASDFEPHFALIATYTSELDARAQVERYTAFLRRFVGSDKRRKYLEHAEAAGLDLASITKELAGREWREDAAIEDADVASGIEKSQGGVLTIGRAAKPTSSGDTFASLAERPRLDDSDQRKIQSLEWLTFQGSDRPEAVRQSNTAMRGFLAAGKVEAAKQVRNMLPYDTDEVAEAQIGKKHFTFSLEDELTEFRAMRAFLEANDAFITWDQKRSTPPELPLVTAGGDADTRSFLERQQAEEDFARREARWEDELSAAAENALAQMDGALGQIASWCSTVEGLHLDFTFAADLGAAASESDIVKAAEEAIVNYGDIGGAVVWSNLSFDVEQGVVASITWSVQLQVDYELVDNDQSVAEVVKRLNRDRPLSINVSDATWTARAATLGRAGVIKVIRKRCVPALIESMHEVYYANDEHALCVNLAQNVSTNPPLFEAYRGNHDRLASFLGRIRVSALKLLEDPSLDAFGFPRMN